MNKSKAEAIVARLLSSAAGLKYGSVSVTAKIHNGRVMQVSYETTESMRETETAETQKAWPVGLKGSYFNSGMTKVDWVK